MEILAADCVAGSCPTIYQTDEGEVVVQGKLMEIRGDEALVVISPELLRQAADSV
jgi:hypothetical protein